MRPSLCVGLAVAVRARRHAGHKDTRRTPKTQHNSTSAVRPVAPPVRAPAFDLRAESTEEPPERSRGAQPRWVSTQAAATAGDVVQLEAVYQHAFTAIETLVAAIERVHQLRRQQRPLEQANKLGVAVKLPEPWHVRTAHDIELRQLNKRFIQVVNSSW